jgi:hypothetical protein
MMSFDESNWPVLVMTSAGRTTLEDTRLYTDTLERVLARQQPYAMITLPQRDEVQADQDASNHFMKWLKENKPRISKYCVGIVSVVESDEYYAKHAKTLTEQGPYIYGCPFIVVRTRPEADKWVKEQLEQAAS